MEGRFHDHHRSDVDHGAKQLGKQNKKHREHKRGGGGVKEEIKKLSF
jgi:hypothetical protein